jgi:hypothetical protein
MFPPLFIIGFYESTRTNLSGDYACDRLRPEMVLEPGEIFYVDGSKEQLINLLTGGQRHIKDFVLEPLEDLPVKYASSIDKSQFRLLSRNEVQRMVHAAEANLNPRLHSVVEKYLGK